MDETNSFKVNTTTQIQVPSDVHYNLFVPGIQTDFDNLWTVLQDACESPVSTQRPYWRHALCAPAQNRNHTGCYVFDIVGTMPDIPVPPKDIMREHGIQPLDETVIVDGNLGIIEAIPFVKDEMVKVLAHELMKHHLAGEVYVAEYPVLGTDLTARADGVQARFYSDFKSQKSINDALAITLGKNYALSVERGPLATFGHGKYHFYPEFSKTK